MSDLSGAKPSVIGAACAKAFKYIKNYGFMTTAFLFFHSLKGRVSKSPYRAFVSRCEENIRYTEDLPYKPLFSFVVTVWGGKYDYLQDCIDSFLNQTYSNFEVIIVCDKSEESSILEEKYKEYESIKLICCKKGERINRGIAAAKGEYIGFLDRGDIAAPNAVYELTRAVNRQDKPDFVYSDQDCISADGRERSNPFFKPDWSPDTLMSFMYTGKISVYRLSLVREIGGIDAEAEGLAYYDLTLRFTEKTNKILHIPKVLCHCRKTEPYGTEEERRIKAGALQRRGLKGNILPVRDSLPLQVQYAVPNNTPLVSIVIPSKDNCKIAERCLKSLWEKTLYRNFEIIVVDNGSSTENKAYYESLCKKYNAFYHYEKMDFNFSKMCNMGASMSKGEYLLFLNDDTEIIKGDWLGLMLGQAALGHCGAVGAKLLYPDSSLIQHCGVINIQAGPCHALARMDDRCNHSFFRNVLTYNYIGVTAACLIVSRGKFYRAGGFDEEFAVTYNDVDLCFRLYELGYYNSVRNDAVLYHYESVSRGIDTQNTQKLRSLYDSQARLYKKHPQLKFVDPFYNVNLTKNKIDFDTDPDWGAGFSRVCKTIDDVRHLTDNENIKANIDLVSVCDNIEVFGWAFIPKSRLNGFNKKRIVFVGENNSALVFTTKTKIRNDVCIAGGGSKDINLCGFSASVNKKLLTSGTYRLGVMVENNIMCKKYIKVLDNYVKIQ